MATIVGAVSALPALAQTAVNACQISLAYAPVALPPVVVVPPAPIVSAVPGLGMVGVAALVAVIGIVAWRKRPAGGHKALSIALMAGAALLATQGGGSVIQAVRAAAPYTFSNVAGGTVADADVAFAQPATLLTVTNSTSVPITITSNANGSETGSCTVGTQVAPGGSCTTQAVCPVLKLITITQPPAAMCGSADEDILATQPPGQFGGGYTVFRPVFDSASLVIDPVTPAPTIDFSYVAKFVIPPGQESTVTDQQKNDAGSGTTSITLTPPTGYGFDDNGVASPTPKVFTGDYGICASFPPIVIPP